MPEDAHQPYPTPAATGANYDTLLADVAALLDASRHTITRAVNAVMTATYWEIGRRIVEHEQAGAARAEYGTSLLDRLSDDLVARFGRGFSRRNVAQMRQFYLAYPNAHIRQTVSGGLPAAATPAIVQTVSAQSAFPLPWSHYIRLLAVKDTAARDFYAAEALQEGWSVRQLDRQIATLTCERGQLARGRHTPAPASAQPSNALTPANTF